MTWQTIKTAPLDGTHVRLRTMDGYELVGFWTDSLVGHEDEEAGGWCAAEEGRHPKDWTDGVCWESNDEGLHSDPPIRWMPLAAPDTGRRG